MCKIPFFCKFGCKLHDIGGWPRETDFIFGICALELARPTRSRPSFTQTSNLLHSGIIAEFVLQLMVATLLVQQYVCYHCNINVSRRWTSHTGC